MAIQHLKGALVMTDVDYTRHAKLADVSLNGGRVRWAFDKLEVPAASSANSTFLLARLPSYCRILPGSKIYFDDMASTGSPKLDIGVFSYRGNLEKADDPDALNDGISVTASGSSDVVKGINNYGKLLWEYVEGETVDPFGLLDIKITLTDAAANTGGTLVLSILYTID